MCFVSAALLVLPLFLSVQFHDGRRLHTIHGLFSHDGFSSSFNFFRCLLTGNHRWYHLAGIAWHSGPAEIMQAYVDRSFSAAACLAELTEENNIFHAVFYNNEPAGYFKVAFDYPHPAVPLQPVTKMERLYLLKKFYRLKLGQMLMQQAIDLSKANGDKGMWLNVWKGNEGAIRFYQEQGFETVGESEFVLTETYSNPNWVMLLRY